MRDYDKYKPYLKDYVNSITTISPKNKSNYICPICGSGKGENGTGAFSLKGNLWHCFSCNEGGDIFDLYARLNNCDNSDAYKQIEAMYEGTTVNEETPTQPKQEKSKEEITREIQVFHEVLTSGTDMGEAKRYFNKRGISDEAIKRFKLGYNGRNAIIPYNSTSYLERGLKGDFKRNTGNVGTMDATHNEKGTLFICEGWADAISLWELGFNAISVNSTNNYEKAISFISGKCYKNVVIAFDNDKPGKEASSLLLKALYKIGTPCVQFDYKQLKSNHKDINEYLNDNKEELREVCNRMALEANNKAIETQNDNKGTNNLEKEKDAHTANMSAQVANNSLKMSTMLDYIMKRYAYDVKSKKETIKSHFENLDNKFNGGFYPGLYVLGAVSSLGKTTFLLNIADNIARSGKDVLFFSLEQSTIELFTKSLARIIASKKSDREKQASCSAMDLRMRKLSKAQEQEEYNARMEYMETIAQHMTIIECNFDTNITQITETIERYMKETGKKPVVFVDYLQIIPPRDTRMTERQNADDIVRALKKVQANNDLLIFAVSSFNRGSYLNPIDYESFKESGGIEYTADCIMGLQLQAINEESFTNEKKDTTKREILKKAKRANPRKIEMVCLKNRGGISSFSCFFNYYPNCDIYEEGSPLKVEYNYSKKIASM